MGIRIASSGMHTTVQDRGRYGAQRYGFSVSGAMDQVSYRLANLLVGNIRNEAVLEMTVTGCTLSFTQSNIVAITGSMCHPKLNGEPVNRYQSLTVEEGDVLTIGLISNGIYSYIAFAGGLDIPEVMSSQSTSTRYGIGGINGRTLKAGDIIEFKEAVSTLKNSHTRQLSHMTIQKNSEKVMIRVIPAPESEVFTEEAITTFFEKEFIVSKKSDRMGYRLDGQKVATKEQQAIISEATVLGDIQVPPDGQPIVLLADRQTTGGYPVIGTICTVDIPKMVQCNPGKRVQFLPISLQDAHRLLKEQENVLETLATQLNDLKHITVDVEASIPGKKSKKTEEWDTEEIMGLIRTVDDSSLTFFSYEDDTVRMKLDKRQSPADEDKGHKRTESESVSETDSINIDRTTIDSVLVGLFYSRHRPEGSPYVREGDRVSAGQMVGRIEAMNINYEIKAKNNGVVCSIFVADGQMVEFGQPLMELKTEKSNESSSGRMGD